jgi:hypothetical protein
MVATSPVGAGVSLLAGRAAPSTDSIEHDATESIMAVAILNIDILVFIVL